MKHLLRNVAIGCAALCALAVSPSPDARAAVRTERPRIWLTPEFKSTLVARYNRNTANAVELRSWCDAHINDDLSPYITSRAIEILKSINYALMYQMTGNTAYANRAVAIIEYALAHPYSGYTIDTWIEFDNFYTTRYLVPPTAIVLDWCYNAMTADQRSAFTAQLDRWASRVMAAQPWAWHDPSNNFYYGYMWMFFTVGYATYGDNANAQQYIDYARGTMLDQAIKFTRGETLLWELWGSAAGRAKGGLWNEGTSYGNVNHEFLFSSVQAAISAEGLDYSSFSFPGEALKFYIYAKHPTGGLMYSEGDGAEGTIDPTERIPLLLAMSLATGDAKRHGKYWLDTHTERCDWAYKLYNEFIWYDDQVAGLDYSGSLPDYYYLEGTRTLFWRSSWALNATWLAMKLGVLNTDHAHNGLGGLMIYRNGFLVTDKAVETGNSMLHGDIHHSVLYIPPAEDKKLFWGETNLKFPVTSTANYLYLAGNLTGPYVAQPDYRSNTVAYKDREILIIKPENVIAVMDRGTSFDAARDKTFQLYLHNQAVPSGADYRSSNGSSDLVVHSAFPAAASVTLDVYDVPRLRISTAETQASKCFLNLLKVTSAGGAFAAAQATASASDIAAAAFYGIADPVDYLIAFSAHPNANPSASTSFTIDFTRSHSAARTYLANLVPNTAYYVSGSVNGATASVTVSRTPLAGLTPYQSDASGLLFCEVNLGEAEQPPNPPPRVGID